MALFMRRNHGQSIVLRTGDDFIKLDVYLDENKPNDAVIYIAAPDSIKIYRAENLLDDKDYLEFLDKLVKKKLDKQKGKDGI